MKNLLFLILLIPALSFAGWSTTSGTITDIYSHDGSILLTTNIADGPCNAGYFWWPITDPDSQIMLSLALTSFSTGKKVMVVYDPETPECVFGFSKITHLRLINSN